MESLSDEIWDLVIAGTGVQQSLLALSLSRSEKKILHVDRNGFYGGSDAGITLQDASAWARDLTEVGSAIFSDASIREAEQPTESEGARRLGSSRSYTLSLQPQIVYARSAFLPTLVSSQIHSQLEFLAVGSSWVLRNDELHKIPSTREDVFNDDSLSMRDKRSLMKFLRFVLMEETDTSDEPHDTSEQSLQQTLESFKVPATLHSPILALALSSRSASQTSSNEAVNRIRRHLQSVGYFGPGFGAVVAKYGGNAEICQVACRAQAVGGGVYLLGHGIKSIQPETNDRAADQTSPLTHVVLSDGTIIRTKRVVGGVDDLPWEPRAVSTDGDDDTMLQSISIVGGSLKALFLPTSENGPVPAAAIVLVEQTSNPDDVPIYLQVHSEDTGECPAGQCIIYAATCQQNGTSPQTLHTAVTNLLKSSHFSATKDLPEILWHMSYKTHARSPSQGISQHSNVTVFTNRRFELAVEDDILEPVRAIWDQVTPGEGSEETFLRFTEREQTFDDGSS